MSESRFDIAQVKDKYYYITSRERESKYQTLVYPCSRYGEIREEKVVFSREYPTETTMLLGHKILAYRLEHYMGGLF
jgi:hypothetical protein